jgi:hypothetical protein
MSGTEDIEVRLRWVSITTVALFAAALTGGMILYLFLPESAVSARLIEAGLVLLMAAPAVRILIAVAERLRRHDWTFVAMTLIVAIELAIVLWRAAGQ